MGSVRSKSAAASNAWVEQREATAWLSPIASGSSWPRSWVQCRVKFSSCPPTHRRTRASVHASSAGGGDGEIPVVANGGSWAGLPALGACACASSRRGEFTLWRRGEGTTDGAMAMLPGGREVAGPAGGGFEVAAGDTVVVRAAARSWFFTPTRAPTKFSRRSLRVRRGHIVFLAP